VDGVYRIHLTEEGATLIGSAQAPHDLRMATDTQLPAWHAHHAYTKAYVEAERARSAAPRSTAATWDA